MDEDRSQTMAVSIRSLICATALPLMLGACGDPLAKVEKLSDVELAKDAPRPDLVAPENEAETPVARPGLLAQMLGGSSETDQADAPEPSEAAKPRQRGFLGIFSAPEEEADAEPTEVAPQVAALPTQDGAEKPLSDPSNAAPKPQRKRGLLGGSAKKKKQPPSVPAGTLLSFGVVKPVCDLPRAKRGKEIHAFPARGKSWRLYDSAPGKTAPHPFYVTGFSDGCARTFTAAVAVFGAPSMHELLRYGLPAKVQPYSTTDQAYEKIKSRICRVARNKPCGAKVSKLEKNTVFVSAYEKYGNNGRWFNMLLHDGEVKATDIKSGGG